MYRDRRRGFGGALGGSILCAACRWGGRYVAIRLDEVARLRQAVGLPRMHAQTQVAHAHGHTHRGYCLARKGQLDACSPNHEPGYRTCCPARRTRRSGCPAAACARRVRVRPQHTPPAKFRSTPPMAEVPGGSGMSIARRRCRVATRASTQLLAATCKCF